MGMGIRCGKYGNSVRKIWEFGAEIWEFGAEIWEFGAENRGYNIEYQYINMSPY